MKPAEAGGLHGAAQPMSGIHTLEERSGATKGGRRLGLMGPGQSSEMFIFYLEQWRAIRELGHSVA